MNGTTMTANYKYLPDGTKLSTADNSGSGFAYLGSLVYRKDGSSYTFESTDFSGGRLDNGLSMSATNRYRFSGKEQQTVADVDLLDFGARFYDDEICRWTTIDPLAKKYFSMTIAKLWYTFFMTRTLSVVNQRKCTRMRSPNTEKEVWQ